MKSGEAIVWSIQTTIRSYNSPNNVCILHLLMVLLVIVPQKASDKLRERDW